MPYQTSERPPQSCALKVPYAELHCHSNFSFLDGASHPEELVEEAVRQGLEALAITDHDGLYGVVRFAEAASALGLATVFGAELTLNLGRSQAGRADPEGNHLVVLARNPRGYGRLSRAISGAQLLGGEKGRPLASLDVLGQEAGGDWVVLTGCRKGRVADVLRQSGTLAARRELEQLVDVFGRDNVYVELWDHGQPLDWARNDALVEIATSCRVHTVATNNVHYATQRRHQLATALAAVRARRSLDEVDGWLPASAMASIRSGQEQADRFWRYPEAVAKAAEIGRQCAFDLRLIAPNLPHTDVPSDHTDASWLRYLTYEGARDRYGPRSVERVEGAYAQIDRELNLIEQLDFPGYFLIVRDVVSFCRERNIYCQGRGSAVNSAVCYALGITNADAVELKLLFERFLAPERDGAPDIDLDIESGRREEVIQYVYRRYGRDRAAQVCNVNTYRPKSAVRDMAKAMGYSPGQQDAWSKQIDHWGPIGAMQQHDVPQAVMELAEELQDFPRHLGIHSGGMVLCDRPVVEVCPVEWGRMENRTVLQWDKEDCAAAGLVKFDLLGLGMLEVLHDAVDLIDRHHEVEVDLAVIPQEDEVYARLSRADAIGVFQVESRAQLATLPRLKPRKFYDLVVEVALIRPGPIQGGSVHPYIRRRNGNESPTLLHPLLEKSLSKTLGVPLFQEQLMQMAIDVAGFTPGEADQLRQAMGSKRSIQRMEQMKTRLYEGMAERGIEGEIADQIYEKLAAFASFGFPESHAVSFAYLVYASAWMKYHYPASFLAALLNAQPMGFWSPQTLTADARRHGVVLRSPDVNVSDAKSKLETDGSVRLGLGYVRTIGAELAKHIEEQQPYVSMEDVVRINDLSLTQVEALATAGAFAGFGLNRRQALWAAGAVVQSKVGRLPGVVVGASAPTLPGMSAAETASADLWATGIAPNGSPLQYIREALTARGVIPIARLASVESGSRVVVGGVVTHRQRPATAQGITFVNLEDETGLANVVCSRGVWARFRRVARSTPAMMVTGRLERSEGVINVVAERIEQLPLSGSKTLKARTFR